MQTVGRRFWAGIACVCLTIAVLVAWLWGRSPPADRGDPLQLLQASGFNVVLRADAALDSRLSDELPQTVPLELRAELAGILHQSLQYADMRRAMAQAVAARLDGSTIDRQLSWWESGSGKLISEAQFAVFRHLLELPSGSTGITGLAATSRSTRNCLRLAAGFRGDCDMAKAARATSAVASVMPQAVKASAADAEAYEQSMRVLVDAYSQTRSDQLGGVQHRIAAAVERFARDKVGKDSEGTLQRAIALVDAEQNLDQAQMILHLLRSVEPRDPRIPVELARVAIKQAPAMSHTQPGEPPEIGAEFLEAAQGWMDIAIALDPRRADTLVLAGHLAYLKHQFPQSIALLEQASRIGTNNPWLRQNLSDALWAMGRDQGMDHALLGRAATELASALSNGIPAGMQWQANHSLAHIYEDLGDVAKGRAQYQKLISSSRGYDKADAWNDYAIFLFATANDLDGAIGAARQATRMAEYDIGRITLAQALLVKAGRLYVAGQRDAAARLVREVQASGSSLLQDYSSLARIPLTLPGIFALHEAGVIGDLQDSAGGRALLFASAHANAADMERLIRWHADPNYQDPVFGTPLQMAINGSNAAAVRVLLAHGADVGARDLAGKLPLELAEKRAEASGARGAEVLALLGAATR